MARYEWDLDYWKQIKSQQEQEFTITERNVSEIKRIGVGSGGRSNSSGGNGSGSGGEGGGGNGQLRHVRLKNATPPLTPSDLDFKHYEVRCLSTFYCRPFIDVFILYRTAFDLSKFTDNTIGCM